jgi:NADPH:quinone reductase-like Zn-dependent oxidoreductase
MYLVHGCGAPWVRDGSLPVVQVHVSRVYSFADYLDAFDDMMSRKVVGKICVVPTLQPAKARL